MYKSNAIYKTTYDSDEEVSVDMALDEVELTSPVIVADPRLRVTTLHNRIQMLREVSTKLLVEIKQCKTSFQDANEVIGELNGNIKKFQ